MKIKKSFFVIMIIGVVGRAGSGKTEMAKALVGTGHFRMYAFADPLKLAVQQIFGFSHEQLYGSQKEVTDPFWGVTPRQVLQHVGTEHWRERPVPGMPGDETIWIQCFRRHVTQDPRPYVIHDVRFLDEARAIKSLGGILVRVTRPGVPLGTHVSETEGELIRADAEYHNIGTLLDMREWALNCVRTIEVGESEDDDTDSVVAVSSQDGSGADHFFQR